MTEEEAQQANAGRASTVVRILFWIVDGAHRWSTWFDVCIESEAPDESYMVTHILQ